MKRAAKQRWQHTLLFAQVYWIVAVHVYCQLRVRTMKKSASSGETATTSLGNNFHSITSR